MDVDLLEVLLRVAGAAVLGGLIGLDRELRGHAAGLRTNTLVSAAAAVFADVSMHGFAELAGYDPSRVAADVVSGIGFLGAGAIFAMGGRPRGLTTAAALWASAAAGLAVGVGRWGVGVGLVALSLIVLIALDAVEKGLLARRRSTLRNLYVILPDPGAAGVVQRHLHDHGVRIRTLDMIALGDSVGVDLVLIGHPHDLEAALSSLNQLDEVHFASDEKGEAAAL